MRNKYLDDFLNCYYSNLARIIRATGSDPDVLFPAEELQSQLRQFGVYGVIMAPIVLQVLLADSSEITDIDDVAESILQNADVASKPISNLSGAKTDELALRLRDVFADARQYGWL